VGGEIAGRRSSGSSEASCSQAVALNGTC